MRRELFPDRVALERKRIYLRWYIRIGIDARI